MKFPELSIAQMIQANVLLDGSQPAISDSCKSLTRKEFQQLVQLMRMNLKALNLGRGDIIASYIQKSVSSAALMVAVIANGSVYLPISREEAPERLNYILKNATVTAVISDHSAGSLRPFTVVALADIITVLDATPPPTLQSEERTKNDPAYIVYTSGSSGRPKGVAVSEQSLVAHLHSLNEIQRITAADKLMVLAPNEFDVSIGQTLLGLCFGAEVFMAPAPKAINLDAIDLILQHGITTCEVATSLWTAMAHGWSRLKQSRLRQLVIGGEHVHEASIRRWKETVGTEIVLLNTYGPSEAVIECTSHVLVAPNIKGYETGIGRPLPNRQVYILDKNLDPVPAQIMGEICIGGDGLALGYHNDPATTASAFVHCGLGRLYKSGDFGMYRPDGVIEFCSRADDQMKIRGIRVEPSEVERVISQIEGVSRVVVVQERASEELLRLVAYVEPLPNRVLNRVTVASELRQHLPAVMHPAVHFVRMLPLNERGKVERSKLREVILEEQQTGRSGENPLERFLCEAFGLTLGRSDVRCDDDFFEAGGDSLGAIRLRYLIELELRQTVPLALILNKSSPRLLAASLSVQSAPNEQLSKLILIRATSGGTIVCLVPPITGGPAAYKQLVNCLRTLRPDLLFEEIGTAVPLEALTLSKVCSYSLRSLLGHLSGASWKAPLVLFGWSFGAVVAHEMGYCLRTRACEANGVRLIKTILADGSLPRRKSIPSRSKLVDNFAKNEYGVDTFALKQLKPLSDGESSDRLLDLQRFLENGRASSSQTFAGLQADFRRYEIYDSALRGHQATPEFTDVVAIFSVSTLNTYTGPNESSLLGATAEDVRVVPGDHYTIMREPDVKTVAEVLLEFL